MTGMVLLLFGKGSAIVYVALAATIWLGIAAGFLLPLLECAWEILMERLKGSDHD